MAKKVLRTALVGAGGIGKGYHLRQILAHEGFELVAVVDPNENTLKDLHAQHQVPVFTQLDDMLHQIKPDLCVIASPTPCHVPQALSCMQAGCDVFLEKPIGMNRAEGEQLKACRDQLGRKIMIYQPHRVKRETLAAEQIIASGKLGRIFTIRRNFSYFYRRDHWQGYKKNGGGNLANHGAHYLDQCIHLSGGAPVKAFSVLRPLITTGDADDVAKAILYTDNGIMLDIDINFVSANRYDELEIMGTLGAARLEKTEDNRMIFRVTCYDPAEHDGNNRVFPFKEEIIQVSDIAEPLYYDKCYEYYAENAPAFVPVEETLTVMGAIDMCRAASGEY